MNFLGSLIGLGGAAAGSIPSLLRSGVENRMRAMAAGRGPSAAQTMLQQQGAANARNALSVASAQPGGLGLLQGLRSMEEMNRTTGQQATNARIQEEAAMRQNQLAAAGAAKQAEDARHQALYRLGAGVAGMGSAFDAQQTAAQQATDAARQTQVQNQVATTPLPTTQLAEPTLGQPQDPNALPAWMQSIRLR